MREVWVITACLAVVDATSAHYTEGLVASDIEQEFYRVQGDLYSLCRTKVNIFKLDIWSYIVYCSFCALLVPSLFSS